MIFRHSLRQRQRVGRSKLIQTNLTELQQQQQHKLYLHDDNYVVTVLQKLQHKVTIYNNDNAMQ